MDLSLRYHDNYPVLVTCQSQEVSAFEIEGRVSLRDIVRQAEAMSKKHKQHVDKVIISELANAVELKFFNGHNSKAQLVATTTYTYRAKGDKITIQLKDKDNTPMLSFKEHDEDNQMLRELPKLASEKDPETLAMERDIAEIRARPQTKDEYYRKMQRELDDNKQKDQALQEFHNNRIKSVAAAADTANS